MPTSRKTKIELESAASIILLAILAVIAAGVLAKQTGADLGRFGLVRPTTEQPAANIPSVQMSAERFGWLGFVPVAPAKTFGSEDLYEKINGKAPLYLESGFVKLTTRVLALAEDPNLKMELYLFDMGSSRNAFSVYSTQRRPNANSLADLRFGYATANSVYFARNRYYVELIGFSQSAHLLNKMAHLASALLAEIPAETIPELGFFPAENLVAGSAKLQLNSAFGCADLSDTFSAKYNINGEGITAFFSKRLDSKDADKTAETYYQFLIEGGGTVKSLRSKIPSARALDLFGSTEIIFTVGPFVGGIHEAEDQAAAEKVARMLFKKVAGAAR